MEASPAPKKVTFFTTGFHPLLIRNDFDEYFICPLCKFYVKKPIQCKECERAYCSQCLQRYRYLREDRCISCQKPLELTKLRKFPQLVYKRTQSYCENYFYGCQEQGTFKEMTKHRQVCEYEYFDCQGVHCLNEIQKREMPYEGIPVCSETCKETHEFSQIYGTKTIPDYILYIHEHLQQYRQNLVNSLNQKISNDHSTSAKTLKQCKNDIEFLQKQIDEVKSAYHIGTFRRSKWTCCGEPKGSLGCKTFDLN